MSRNTMRMECSPEDVFDVLADGWSFALWVVGAARIRDVDQTWPEVGSKIHHSVGVWPALIDDTTSVRSIDRPRSIELTARAWPAGEAVVQLSCTADGTGTQVEMVEDATSGPGRLLPRPARDRLLHWRNTEALRRLALLAEATARRGAGAGPGDLPTTRPQP